VCLAHSSHTRYPDATPFERMQWSVLNCAVALMGYWCAAAVVDKPW
jgi:hypothetical protein